MSETNQSISQCDSDISVQVIAMTWTLYVWEQWQQESEQVARDRQRVKNRGSVVRNRSEWLSDVGSKVREEGMNTQWAVDTIRNSAYLSVLMTRIRSPGSPSIWGSPVRTVTIDITALTHPHTHPHSLTHTYSLTHSESYAHTHSHTHSHTYSHTHTYTRTHAHTHTFIAYNTHVENKVLPSDMNGYW